MVLRRFKKWVKARSPKLANEWSSGQWPKHVRKDADRFAEQLRKNGFAPSVVYFAEWADKWSMFDIFHVWFMSRHDANPLFVYGDRFEIYAYGLPDNNKFARKLARAGQQQFEETDWFIWHLRQAVAACKLLVERSVVVVLRDCVGPSEDDEDTTASLKFVPDWLR